MVRRVISDSNKRVFIIPRAFNNRTPTWCSNGFFFFVFIVAILAHFRSAWRPAHRSILTRTLAVAASSISPVFSIHLPQDNGYVSDGWIAASRTASAIPPRVFSPDAVPVLCFYYYSISSRLFANANDTERSVFYRNAFIAILHR